jgi:PDZ domain
MSSNAIRAACGWALSVCVLATIVGFDAPGDGAKDCSRSHFMGGELLPVFEADELAGLELRLVCPDSPFARAGLVTGDRITAVGAVEIHSHAEAADALRLLAGEGPVTLRLSAHDGSTRTIEWPPGAPGPSAP